MLSDGAKTKFRQAVLRRVSRFVTRATRSRLPIFAVETLMARSNSGWQVKGDHKGNWDAAEADFSDKDAALNIMGNPVIERWEEPYMQILASIAASQGGRVLEVGFGMGMAAACLQTFPIDEHVIIEANADVFQRLVEFAKNATHTVTPLKGMWEDVVPSLADASFDGILYDTYPLSEDDLHLHQFRFIKEAHRLLRPGGVLTYCNVTSWGHLKAEYPDDVTLFRETQAPRLEELGFTDYSVKSVAVNPPPTCKYYQYKTIPAPTIRR